MLKIFGFLTRKQDLETQAFITYYEGKHVPLICDLAPAPIVYKRNYLVRGDAFNVAEDGIDFDVVTELVFPDRAAFEAWAAAIFPPGNAEQVARDEAMFLDRSRTRGMVVDERVTFK
jgi:hypothetical protein